MTDELKKAELAAHRYDGLGAPMNGYSYQAHIAAIRAKARLDAAPATAHSVPAGKAVDREVAWLIERKYPVNSIGATEPRWYAERPNGDHWWTPVPNGAMRFATKADAEVYPAYQMIAGDPAISITEHVWVNDGFSWSHGRAALAYVFAARHTLSGASE